MMLYDPGTPEDREEQRRKDAVRQVIQENMPDMKAKGYATVIRAADKKEPNREPENGPKVPAQG